MAVACPPAAVTSAAADSAISSVTSTQTPFAPAAANIVAALRPIPPPAPVMIVTLSASRTAGRPPSGFGRVRRCGPGAGLDRGDRGATMVLAAAGVRGRSAARRSWRDEDGMTTPAELFARIDAGD